MTSMPPEQSQTSISLEILEHNSDGDDDQLLVVRSPDAWNHPVLYSRPSTPLFPRIPSPLLHLTFSRPESTLAAPDFISRQHAVLDSASQELTALDLAIDKGADLSKPLKATCDALQAVIRITTVKLNIEVDEDWIRLIKKLRFHLATVESQLVKLEEDQKTDKSALPFDQAVRESLRSYSSKLRSIYGLAGQKDIVPQHNTGIIGEALRELDIRFNRYTKALHVFIASTVEYMNKDIPKAGRMSLKKALETHSSRPENINAYGAQHRQCQPGTRTKTLDAIRQWADGDDPPSWMFCLLDFAGSGKSTVSKHMDREWDKDRKLIARFFFSRDTTDTMSTKWFCSIVADAFAFRDENFKAIMKEFQRQPNYGLLSFEQQFEGLIVDPLKALDRRAILIIDALDECDNDNGDRDQLLDTISNQLRSIPHLRVFVTGRPERDITQWAASTVGVRHANFLQLEGGHGDVEKYIKQRLFNFPSHLQAQVSHVVEKAEGVFIWARIACDLLCKAIDKQALLNSLGKEVTLDYLYTIALEQSVPRDSYSHQATIMVLGMILAVRRPLSIDELASLSPNPDVVEAVVTSLGSILIYRHRNEPIRLIHATLREFLTTMTKAEPWFVQLGPGHYTLADRCIDLLARATRTEQGSGPNIKENTFQSAIEYSWDSWVDHCGNSYRKLGLNERVIEFIDTGYEYLLDDSLRAISDGFIRNVVSLCRHNMSPYITQALVSRSLRWIKMRRRNMTELLSRPRLLKQILQLLFLPPQQVQQEFRRKLDGFEWELRSVAKEMDIDLEGDEDDYSEDDNDEDDEDEDDHEEDDNGEGLYEDDGGGRVAANDLGERMDEFGAS